MIIRPTGLSKIIHRVGGTRIITSPVISAGGSLRSNAPGYANSRNINFSQTPPNTQPANSDIPIVGSGSPGWAMIYYANPTAWSKITDVSAPMDSNVWQCDIAAGTHGDVSNGWGSGNVFTNMSGVGTRTKLYSSLIFKVSSDYHWHQISNKFVFMSANNFLIQLKEGTWWLHAENLGGGQWLDPGSGPLNGATLIEHNNGDISKGVWHELEFLLEQSGGVCKVWLDGVLRTHATGITYSGTFNEYNITLHRGGGGECASCGSPVIPNDCEMFYNDFYIEWN